MNGEINPDERFDQVESTLNQLSNSLKHLLPAQVLMSDLLSRSERLVEQLAEQAVQTSQRLDRLAEKTEALLDSQKHTGSKLDALTDIVRRWIERHGNGSASS